MKKAEKSQ